MNLSPEVAAVLRQALAQADQMPHASPAALVAYDHLARTIENLLEPVYAAEADQLFAAQLAALRVPDERKDLPF